MADRNIGRAAPEQLPTQALMEQLRQEQEPAALLSAAELLIERPDAASCADSRTALRRFRTDYLPSAKLDPDAPQPRIAPRGLVRFLPLVAILVLALGMLASAGQKQARTQSNVTVITRRGTEDDVRLTPTDGAIPSFSIALPEHFALEGTKKTGDGEAVVYRDLTDAQRTVSISFAYGDSLSFAPDSTEHAEEIRLANFSESCVLAEQGDVIRIAAFDIGRAAPCRIVIEAHGLSRAEAIAAAESLHILSEEETVS